MVVSTFSFCRLFPLAKKRIRLANCQDLLVVGQAHQSMSTQQGKAAVHGLQLESSTGVNMLKYVMILSVTCVVSQYQN